MKNNHYQQNHKYLLWPIVVLVILTAGVFLTTREVPNQQEIRSHAQLEETKDIPGEITFDDVVSDQPTNPTTEPTTPATGSVISLSFSLPGISSRGGNLKPLHPTREVTVLFYDLDSNTADKSVAPLYTVKSTVTFDANLQSPTYTKFVQKNLHVKDTVKEGEYQVGIKTDQALLKIYKKRDIDLSGIHVPVGKFSSYDIAFGTLIPGDIVPVSQGDKAIDIGDYNELMNCFGTQLETVSCTAKTNADLDDNGVVDGIDYNLFLRSLFSIGTITPTVTPSLSPTIMVNPTVPVTSVNENTSSSNLSTLLVLLAVPIIFIAGILMLFRNKINLPALHFGSLDKEYFIKQDEKDDEGWFTLADDNGLIRGHYTGGKIKDGFARVQGEMKSDGSNKYMEIHKITWEDKD